VRRTGENGSSRISPLSAVTRHASGRASEASSSWMRMPRPSSLARSTVIGGTTRLHCARSSAARVASTACGSWASTPIAQSSARTVSSEAARHWPHTSWYPPSMP
jgi:hypothetical protein